MTTQANSTKTPEFAFFSDTIRDALKGSVFNNSETGYVSGAAGYAGNITSCFVGFLSKRPVEPLEKHFVEKTHI